MRQGFSKHLGWVPVAGFALGLLAPPCPAQETPYPSPETTKAELEAVCRRLEESDNPYFGRLPERRAEEAAKAESDPRRKVPLLGLLGYELIRLGRFDEAVEHLDEARRLSAQGELASDHELRYNVLATLAMAHLQLAEDQNCIDLNTPASCILPIAPEAVHRKPGEAKAAGDLYLEALKQKPGDVTARWLLAISRMLSGDYPGGVPEALRPAPDALAPEAPFPHWTDVSTAVGLDAVDLSGGAVMEDFDGDGLLDLVSSSWDPCEPMKAWRNDGHGGFENVTHAWGLDGQLGGLNMVQADFDNDGMPDLLVMRGAWLGADGRMRNSLLRNDLKRPAGRFVDVTAAAGLAYPAYPTQAASWADYDGDGDLDLAIGNESPVGTTKPTTLHGRTGRPYPSQLFRNNGDGTFTDVARAAGVTNLRFAKSVAWGDYDDDGDPDLYVSNIGPNRLYRNNGDGTFTDVAPELGVVEPAGGSFGSWFFDYDNDGDLDLWVNRYDASVAQVLASYLGLPAQGGAPVLYRNDGGHFTDVSAEVGLWRPSLPMGTNYGDLDNDGYLDAYLGTGVPDFQAIMPNVMYRNDGGRRFQDVTFSGGFGQLQKGHGVAFGDLDGDGDQDLFEQLGGAFPYDGYRNALWQNPGSDNAWIVLRLEGRKANRFGVGARIEVRVGQGETRRSVYVVAGTGGSFGGSSLQQEIGLGKADAIERITIVWPGSKTRQSFENVAPNRYYRLIEGRAELEPVEVPRIHLGAHRAPGPGTHDREKHPS